MPERKRWPGANLRRNKNCSESFLAKKHGRHETAVFTGFLPVALESRYDLVPSFASWPALISSAVRLPSLFASSWSNIVREPASCSTEDSDPSPSVSSVLILSEDEGAFAAPTPGLEVV